MPKTNPYEEAGRTLLQESGVRVRKYHKRIAGRAWPDGSIQTPPAKTPLSFGVFAHEVGHCVLHWRGQVHRPRWQEEVEAWDYALEQFDRFGLQGKAHAIDRATSSLGYAFSKAIRRGVKVATIKKAQPYWYARCMKYHTIRIANADEMV